MFPQDNYTPHGYLDNPAHAWKAGPGGVLRSRPAIGIGWHYPSFAHAYNSVWHYRANLQLAFQLPDGHWLLDSQDFEQAGIKLYSDYHSKNWLSFVFEGPEGFRARIIFYLAEREKADAIGALVQIRNRGATNHKGRFLAILDYERQAGQGLDWVSGLYARRSQSGISIAAYQEGMALHLRSNSPAAEGWLQAESLKDLRHQLGLKGDYEAGLSNENSLRKIAALEYDYDCPAQGEETFQLVVSREVSEFRAVNQAIKLLADESTTLYEALAQGKAQDDAFWATAPRLTGDWPDYVRRGPVYDFETLRMMARRPMGIYQHGWDAMQLQVPRTVLAEAAIDMLILSYADPTTAKEVLLGTFADAPEPNVPCSREDGSYNMVAIDGTPCGTAPEWCFPFHCIELVYRRTGDQAWLAELYPYLEAFIDFWQRQRTDPQGRPYYKCSWEAGQDNSARFGITDDPSGGGALGEHLWPVDLQAAMAQSCWLLAAWGDELGLGPAKVAKWNGLGAEHTRLMQAMWRPEKNWFHDFDRKTNAFTDVLDTMQLAPLLCRTATPEQIAALQAQLENPPKHGQVFHPLMWPSIVFCLVESCCEAGRSDLAARHSWQAIQAVYRWLDSRPPTIAPDQGGMPGVGREYWPQVVAGQANPPRGGGGAEVYGWGCLSVYLLLRYIVGLQEEHPQPGVKLAFWLRPNLPAELLQPDKIYRVHGIPYREATLDISYKVRDNNGQLEATIGLTFPSAPGATAPARTEQTYSITNGQELRLSF